MLLLPYRDNSTTRTLPLVTMLIAALCTLILFAFQSQDGARDERAFRYYREADLDRIELPRYQAYLADRTDPESAERMHLLRTAPATGSMAIALLQSDARFLAALHQQRIVREDEPDFESWKARRARFEEMLETSVHAHYSLAREHADEPWRYLSYSFLHAGVAHLLGNMAVLLLVGPFVEAALGRVRFLAAYLAGGAAAGALHVLVSDASVVGASGAIAATVGMLAVLYGTRKVPVFYWIFVVFGTGRIPALALLPLWLINEGYQWSLQARGPAGGAAVAYGAHVGGLIAGALLAWALRPTAKGSGALRGPSPGTVARQQGSTLVAQAQDAAARLDIRRATSLYRQLLDLEPQRIEHLGAYLNVTLLGADESALQDAALRLLWAKFSTPTDELRKIFLTMTQPKILHALPIDEHLRLARRLVRMREDAAALRVIDAILRDDHLRSLYARQLADCLLGLFTAYSRHGLHKQAEQINSRLASYFPSGEEIGGIAPANRPPSTLFTSLPHSAAQLSATEPAPRTLRRPPATRS